MSHLPKFFLTLGISLLALGGLAFGLEKLLPQLKLGSLPGDLKIEKENFNLYFPITTCLVISFLLTGLAKLTQFFEKK